MIRKLDPTRFVLLVIASLLIVMFSVDRLNGQQSYPLEIGLRGPSGPYDVKRWKEDWPGCKYENGVTEGRVSIQEYSEMHWMRVVCQANQIGPEKGGIGWRRPIPPADRVELSYWVRFDEDFDFGKGGKLPGLCGGPDSVTGGNPANGTNGFSARFMWRKDGRAEAYLYHLDQPEKYGESIPFPTDIRLPRDKPFMLIMRVGMNEVGQKDGTFEAWVKFGEQDAKKVIHRNDLRWRSVDSVRIDSVLCQVFHGGSDASWAPKKACTVDLANFLLLK